MKNNAGWLDIAEAGGTLGIRFFVVVCTMFGRRAARLFLPVVALYYTLTHGNARRASADWFRRVHGRDTVGWREVYRHVLCFSQVTVDRLFFLRRQMKHFEVHNHGEPVFEGIRASRRGVMFLGAHIGSFEVMRAMADVHNVTINILGYFGNAKMITDALKKLDSRWDVNLIEITPGRVDFILEVKARLDRGEHVAILGDRTGLGGDTVEVEFMGRPASFPLGVYVLASALRCPVYLFLSAYTAPNRYDIYCEPFADPVDLPRKDRLTGARRYARRYAEGLERHGRAYPENWFNFFDFWKKP